VERAFAGDDIGSDSGNIEDIFRASSYGARNGCRMGIIRRTSDDSSSSLDHSLAIMAISFLTFSLRKVAYIGSVEGTGTGGFLMQI
jgi:hypothetical protein